MNAPWKGSFVLRFSLHTVAVKRALRGTSVKVTCRPSTARFTRLAPLMFSMRVRAVLPLNTLYCSSIRLFFMACPRTVTSKHLEFIFLVAYRTFALAGARCTSSPSSSASEDATEVVDGKDVVLGDDDAAARSGATSASNRTSINIILIVILLVVIVIVIVIVSVVVNAMRRCLASRYSREVHFFLGMSVGEMRRSLRLLALCIVDHKSSLRGY